MQRSRCIDKASAVKSSSVKSCHILWRTFVPLVTHVVVAFISGTTWVQWCEKLTEKSAPMPRLTFELAYAEENFPQYSNASDIDMLHTQQQIASRLKFQLPQGTGGILFYPP